MTTDLTSLSLCIVSVICAITFCVLTFVIITCFRKSKQLERMDQRLEQLKQDIDEKEKQLKSPEYSESVLKYIQTYATQITYLRFKEFIDGHETNKITKETMKRFAEKVAREVQDSFNENNISFEDSLFTRELYNSYIINTCITTMKNLLAQAVNDYDAGE